MAESLPVPSVKKKRKTSCGTKFNLVGLPPVQKAKSLPIASSTLAILI